MTLRLFSSLKNDPMSPHPPGKPKNKSARNENAQNVLFRAEVYFYKEPEDKNSGRLRLQIIFNPS